MSFKYETKGAAPDQSVAKKPSEKKIEEPKKEEPKKE